MTHPIKNHTEKPRWISLLSALILLSLLIGPPSYPLTTERFALAKGDFEAREPGSARFHLTMEKPEPLQLRVKYRVLGDEPIVETLSLTVNDSSLQSVRIDRSGETKVTVPTSLLRAGTNEIGCLLASGVSQVLVEKVLYRNLYGINPYVPVAYVVFDESLKDLPLPHGFGEIALRSTMLFFTALFYFLPALLLSSFLFYRTLEDFFRGLKCFLVPAAFPWIALIYSSVTPYHVLYPRQTLFWIILAGAMIPHFFVFRAINIWARLRSVRRSAQSAGVPGHCFILAGRIGSALIISLLFLAVFQLPTSVPTANDHDRGSQAAYEYWTVHGFAYGKDIIQNVGPLGFVNYPAIYTGFLDEPKLLINFLLTASFILMLWQGAGKLPAHIRLVFLIFAGLFISHPDVKIYLLLLLVAHQLISATTPWFILPATLLLAVLALAKGTCFFMALFIITASVASGILARRFIFAVCATTGFVVFLLAIWALAGQPLANFPAFVHATASFSSGYNEALSLFEPKSVRVSGVIALTAGMLSIFCRVLSRACKTYPDIPGTARQLLLAATQFFILFVAWKHGFVRADGIHISIFFQYVLVSSVWTLFWKEPQGHLASRVGRHMSGLLTILGMTVVLSAFSGLHFNPETILKQKYSKVVDTWSGIVGISKHFDKLDGELTRSIAKMQLPRTKSLAGMEPISYFGIFPAIMLYNGLNYVSTPSTISFSSWNEWIMEADANFFKDDLRAPAYLLFDLKPTDNRLMAQDDSLAQLEILHRYEVVGSEAGNILLHRIKGKAPLSRSALTQRKYKVGEWIDIPDHSSVPLWAKAQVAESLVTSLVAFAYKPPQYMIEMLFENGATKTYKFIPRMAVTGFLINPFIVENSDLLTYRS